MTWLKYVVLVLSAVVLAGCSRGPGLAEPEEGLKEMENMEMVLPPDPAKNPGPS